MSTDPFSLDWFSLAGRVALVSGGNTGLGQAFTVALARAGADVFVVGLDDDDGQTERLLTGAGRRTAFLRLDLTTPGPRRRRSESAAPDSAQSTSWSTQPASACSPTSQTSIGAAGTPCWR